MSRRVQRVGSLLILLFMALLGLFTAGCVIVTTINTGHHIKSSRVANDVVLEQGYETDISGNKRR